MGGREKGYNMNTLRDQRKRVGLSVAEVADAANVSESTIRRWESGTVPMRTNYDVVAAAYGTDEEFVVDAVFTPSPEEMADRRRDGRRLEELRLSRGLTVEQVAEICEVAPSRVREWESGKYGIGCREGVRLVREYGMTLEALFEPVAAS